MTYMLIKKNADGLTSVMADGLPSVRECIRRWNEIFAFGGRAIIANSKGRIVATIG